MFSSAGLMVGGKVKNKYYLNVWYKNFQLSHCLYSFLYNLILIFLENVGAI